MATFSRSPSTPSRQSCCDPLRSRRPTGHGHSSLLAALKAPSGVCLRHPSEAPSGVCLRHPSEAYACLDNVDTTIRTRAVSAHTFHSKFETSNYDAAWLILFGDRTLSRGASAFKQEFDDTIPMQWGEIRTTNIWKKQRHTQGSHIGQERTVAVSEGWNAR